MDLDRAGPLLSLSRSPLPRFLLGDLALSEIPILVLFLRKLELFVLSDVPDLLLLTSSFSPLRELRSPRLRRAFRSSSAMLELGGFLLIS